MKLSTWAKKNTIFFFRLNYVRFFYSKNLSLLLLFPGAVLGSKRLSELGKTLTHEHLAIDFRKFYFRMPDTFGSIRKLNWNIFCVSHSSFRVKWEFSYNHRNYTSINKHGKNDFYFSKTVFSVNNWIINMDLTVAY